MHHVLSIFLLGAELSVRAGPSFAAGDAERGVPLADQTGVAPAFAIDGGWRANQTLYVGAFWATGFGVISPSPCPEGYRCTGPTIVSELGGGARLHLPPLGRFDPWIGAGLAFAVQGSNANRSETSPGSSGFCLFGCGPRAVHYRRDILRYGLDGMLEAGIDYRANEHIGIGLTVSTFAGKYLAVDVKEKRDGEEISSGPGSPGGDMHVWTLVAGRLVFDL